MYMVTVNVIDIISDFQFFQKKSSTKSNTFHCSCQNAKQDTNYLNSTMLENELNAKYEKLDLSDEQQNVIMQWIDAIHAQEAAYTVVAFRMGVNVKSCASP